jgi:hypothetical protein
VRRKELPPADWRFSQDENDDAVVEVAVGSSKNSEWVPIFIDYLYVSLTNSSAFSPTDTMPLTSRAKAFMALQATAALLTSLLVIARALEATAQHRATVVAVGVSALGPVDPHTGIIYREEAIHSCGSLEDERDRLKSRSVPVARLVQPTLRAPGPHAYTNRSTVVML